MKKHFLTTRLDRIEPLCGRQIARPEKGQQVTPGLLVSDQAEVRCGWCLQKMVERGLGLTPEQWPLVARKSMPGPRVGEEGEEAGEEEEME